MNIVFWPGDSIPAARLGGKAGTLAAVYGNGFVVPDWFALLPDAFEESLGPGGRERLRAARERDDILPLIEGLTPAAPVRSALAAALARLCADGVRVAVRSSAAEEDGATSSFAGQLESFLFVPPDAVAEKVAAVWRSAFGERVFAYRSQRRLEGLPAAPAVLIQRMVNADAAGVAFSADPLTGRRGVAVVSAVSGTGHALVAGEANADTWCIDRAGKPLPHGRGSEPPDQNRDRQGAVLTDDQARAVAALARKLEQHFGVPQDIEWAIEDKKLWLLQSRPITGLAHAPDPDAPRSIWDNSNIVESYSGVTTPLTFSFARRAYEEVYRQFCRMMGVPRATLAANDDVFRDMLGLIHGRIYYNLLNWYRALAMLPGFTLNRRFMEQMMGVKESLPDELIAGIRRAGLSGRLRDGLQIAGMLVRLAWNHLTLPRHIREFHARLDDALRAPQPALEAMRPDELVACYRSLERSLLRRWDTPITNDFFAMIFFGVLRRLAQKWCGDPGGTLQNNLLSGHGEIISAEPARRIAGLARIARRDAEFVALLCDGGLPPIHAAIEQRSDFQAQYAEYVEKFGDRCLEELKLESLTLHDNPLPLLRSIGHLARSSPESVGVQASARSETPGREIHDLRGSPVRRLIFHWVLRHARARVRDRENLRFERTRLFGRVRRIFIELGRRFRALGLLDDPRDIFHLEVEEALGSVEGTATAANLRGLAKVRKAEFAAYRGGEPPPSRFETRGVPNRTGFVARSATATSTVAGSQQKGLGCSPGVVRGSVRVVTDPREADLRHGEILVAGRTDPGWILLFPFAAGLIVERGSLLSHSAIVARELGIPAIVSLEGATRWLQDGDLVEMDGSTGTVRRLPPEPVHSTRHSDEYVSAL